MNQNHSQATFECFRLLLDKKQERTFSKLNLLLEFGAKLGWLLGVVGQREDVQEPLLYLEDEVVVGVEHLQPILQLPLQLLQGWNVTSRGALGSEKSSASDQTQIEPNIKYLP